MRSKSFLFLSCRRFDYLVFFLPDQSSVSWMSFVCVGLFCFIAIYVLIDYSLIVEHLITPLLRFAIETSLSRSQLARLKRPG